MITAALSTTVYDPGTGAMVGAGPATVAMLGKAEAWHATWTSFCEKLAGNLIGPANGAGTGTTSEQSMSRRCPRTCSLAMAALNSDIMRAWLSMEVHQDETGE